MKFLLKSTTILAILLITCTSALAQTNFIAQGSALVTPFGSRKTNSLSMEWSYIDLTNITGENIQCKVTVFDHDGNDVTHEGCVFTGSNGSGHIKLSSGTGNFDIPAHSTRRYAFNIYPTRNQAIIGYALVEWQSTDPKLRKALIGGALKFELSGDRMTCAGYPINNGQPF